MGLSSFLYYAQILKNRGKTRRLKSVYVLASCIILKLKIES